MKNLNNFIQESGISKNFILNMKEIDYDKLINFLQDMKDKNESFIGITIQSNGRKWVGYSKEENSDVMSNETTLNR